MLCDQSSPVYGSGELPGNYKISPSQCPFPGCSPVALPVEIYHRLFGLLGVELEVVLLAPVCKVLNKFSVGFVAPIPDEVNNDRVIRELL